MFNSLHTHSSGSVLDGVSRPAQLVERALELGYTALGLTDHGGGYMLADFYKAATEAGIHPVLGVEAYVVDRGGMRDRPDPKNKAARKQDNCHLIVLAQDNTGYRNLCRLVSEAHRDGFYRNARTDLEAIERHKEGLIVTSSCINGDIPSLLLSDGPEAALERASAYKDILGDRFYVEIQHHEGLAAESVVNPFLLRTARELHVPLVAACDAHYCRPEDAKLQDLLVTIGHHTTLDDPKRFRGHGDLWMPDTAEMVRRLSLAFPEDAVREAVGNTVALAQRCRVTMEFGKLKLPAPLLPRGKTSQQFLEESCLKLLRLRGYSARPGYGERLRYELAVIGQTGFAAYILLVKEIADEARHQRVPIQARGSAGGSLVCHLLGITEPDPVATNMVFERFLNPYRLEMPDIDLDMADHRRGDMLEWARHRFGADKVCQMTTFGMIKARSAVRDIGKALGYPFELVDAMAKRIPDTVGVRLRDVFPVGTTMSEEEQKILDLALLVEDNAKAVSRHTAGVLIAPCPLDEIGPTFPVDRANPDKGVQIMLGHEILGELGYLKMDFLGLSYLSILTRTLELVEKFFGKQIAKEDIPLGDRRTYRELGRGNTSLVFQIDAGGAARMTKDLRPRTLDDLAFLVALNRPGPMDSVPSIIKRRHGQEEVTSIHPSLDTCLAGTYGYPVYQEQIIEIAQIVCGWDRGRADVLRKVVGKKQLEKMVKEELAFKEAGMARGYTKAEVDRIFSFITPFARYGFNLPHAMIYGLLTYRTAWLKTHYTAAYLTAVMEMDPDRVTTAAQEARRYHVPLLPPDVNRSGVGATLEGNAIRWGLLGIKGVGGIAAETIVANAPYTSLQDFVARSRANIAVCETLGKVGALAAFGYTRPMIEMFTAWYRLHGHKKRPPELDIPQMPDVSVAEQRRLEAEFLGIALSQPNYTWARKNEQIEDTLAEQGDICNVVACVQTAAIRQTKRGPILAGMLEDDSTETRFVAFSNVERLAKEMVPGSLLIVRGKWGRDSIIVSQTKEIQAQPLEVRLGLEDPQAYEKLVKIFTAAEEEAGTEPMLVSIGPLERTVRVRSSSLVERSL